MQPDRNPKEEAFEYDKTEIFISEHYIFHYCAGSVAEKDILRIAETQEKSFSKICSTLKVHYAEKINYYLTDYYKTKHVNLSVKDLFDNDIFADYGCTVTYPIAGAFTRFLIDTFGMERYIELYKYTGEEYETVMQSIFHTSFEDIVEHFWSEMSRIPFNASTLEEMLHSEGF